MLMTSVRNPLSSQSSNAAVSISQERAARWDTFGRKMMAARIAGVNAFGVADRKNASPQLLKKCEDARAGVLTMPNTYQGSEFLPSHTPSFLSQI